MYHPAATVVLFAYNAEDFVEDAIKSILQQTFTNFELLIIDDASTDKTPRLIADFHDPRIRLVTHDQNRGLAFNRIFAINESKGQYIFWMDNDDISHPDRLKQQMDFFHTHPHAVLCGTLANVINEKGETISAIKLPLQDDLLKAAMFFTFPFVSASVGLRKTAISKQCLSYLEKVEQADDYVLYSSLMNSGTFHNLPGALYSYREHNKPVRITTNRDREYQIRDGRRMAWRMQLEQMGIDYDETSLDLNDLLTYYGSQLKPEDLASLPSYAKLLSDIKRWASNKSKAFQKELQFQMDVKWKKLLYHPAIQHEWALLYKYRRLMSKLGLVKSSYKLLRKKLLLQKVS